MGRTGAAVGTRAAAAAVGSPIKVNNRLANLLSMSERGDGRPGSGMYAVFEIMVGRLDALLERLEGVMREVEAVLEGEVGEPTASSGSSRRYCATPSTTEGCCPR